MRGWCTEILCHCYAEFGITVIRAGLKASWPSSQGALVALEALGHGDAVHRAADHGDAMAAGLNQMIGGQIGPLAVIIIQAGQICGDRAVRTEDGDGQRVQSEAGQILAITGNIDDSTGVGQDLPQNPIQRIPNDLQVRINGIRFIRDPQGVDLRKKADAFCLRTEAADDFLGEGESVILQNDRAGNGLFLLRDSLHIVAMLRREPYDFLTPGFTDPAGAGEGVGDRGRGDAHHFRQFFHRHLIITSIRD